VRIRTTAETRAFVGHTTVAGERLVRVQPVDVIARSDVAA
jgi:hypothetical protein